MEEFKMKKTISLITLLAVTVLATACTKQVNDSKKDSSSSKEQTSTIPKTEKQAKHQAKEAIDKNGVDDKSTDIVNTKKVGVNDAKAIKSYLDDRNKFSHIYKAVTIKDDIVVVDTTDISFSSKKKINRDVKHLGITLEQLKAYALNKNGVAFVQEGKSGFDYIVYYDKQDLDKIPYSYYATKLYNNPNKFMDNASAYSFNKDFLSDTDISFLKGMNRFKSDEGAKNQLNMLMQDYK